MIIQTLSRPFLKSTCFLLLLSTALFATPRLKRMALVVGSNYGGDDRALLKYARSDAGAFARVLKDLGGVEQEDFMLLKDPSKKKFLEAIGFLETRLKQGRQGAKRLEVVVYYSGHADEKGLLLGKEKMPYGELKAAITRMPADIRIAVLDACAAGAMTRTKGGKRRPAFLIDESSDMKGHAFLTSNTADEAAQESDRIKGSFFTHSLVSGLRGAADLTGDRRVTLNEAYQYAFHETLARTEDTQGGPQHAGYQMNLSGTGEVVMTDLRGTSAVINLSQKMDGRVFLRDSLGILVVELRKYKGRPVELGVEPGNYQVTLEKQGPLLQALVKVDKDGETMVSEADMQPVKEQTTVSRGGPAQTQSPGDSLSFGESAEAAGVAIGVMAQKAVAGVKAYMSETFRSLDSGNAGEPQTGAPHAGDTAGPAPAEHSEYDTIPVSFAIIPILKRQQGKLRVARTYHRYSINLIANAYYKLDGVGIGFVGQWAEEEVRGAQLGLFGNYCGGYLSGFQGSAYLNIADSLKGFQGSGGLNAAMTATGVQGAGFMNLADKLEGGQGAGFGNFARDVRGGQGAGFGNFARDVKGGQGVGFGNFARDVDGGQGAGFGNFARDVKGGQGAGFGNFTRDVNGGQGAGFGNFARDVKGGQGAGFGNFARDVKGGQGSGFGNFARDVTGGQGSGFFNIARDVTGGQGSGFINIARNVQGAQVTGFINVAKKVEGTQVGMVNLAGAVEGHTIGILNLNRNAKIHPGLWMDEAGLLNLSLKTGSEYFYGLLNIGMLLREEGDNERLISRGMGIGLNVDLARTLLFTDVSFNRFSRLRHFYRFNSNFFIRHRLGVGLIAAEHFRLLGGASFNFMRVYQRSLEYQDYIGITSYNIGDRFLWHFWPGFFVGIDF